MSRSVSSYIHLLAIAFIVALISGCATLPGADSPNVSVVGIEPLPNEGLEARFALKLRVQNPNESTLAYNGLAVSLALDGRKLASGVSDTEGEIPRFSDTVLTVPVSISALAIARQFLARATDSNSHSNVLSEPLVYTLQGKLGAAEGNFGGIRFSDKVELNLSPSATAEPAATTTQ